MRVRLLGPVDVVEAGVPKPVAGLRRKAVLAVLGLAAGTVVSTERLIDVVWDGHPPASGLNTLQSHISYLRGVLGDRDAIVARPPGYLLDLGPDATDLQVATRLIDGAARFDDPAARLADLRAALDLWRDQPLVDVAGLSWLGRQADRLIAMRLDAVHAVIEVRLALGEHAQLIPQLFDLTGQYPHREQFCRQLMLALYRSGRQADALAAYQQLRDRLVDGLGIDAGVEIRELETAILRHDPALDASASPTGSDRPVPRQLPSDVSSFAGRIECLATLDARLDLAEDSRAVAISTVSGTAGVGKTTLAVHWAHRVARLFPDGQLYVNLRGFDPAGPPTDPADALRGFLDALAVPDMPVPTGLPAQSALYRSLLAGKRVLVLLDNARDVEQVRPLLPGAATCMVVVTSRNQLHGLVMDGAHPLTLDPLTLDEARDMLQQRVGKRRVAEEPDAVDDIVEGCARLPLALAIAAARAALQPRLPLRVLAGELRDSQDALSALNGGDAGADVRAVFSWSYRQLSPAAARLFRLLGLHPGPDITAAAAVSVAALPLPRVRQLLGELTRANLVVEHLPGRYTNHDLLHAYATEQAHAGDDDERRAATVRMLDHYLHTAYAANRLTEPAREPITVAPPQPGVRPEHLPSHDSVRAWLDAEYRVLVRLIASATATGYDTHAWRLVWTLSNYLAARGVWEDYTAVQRFALEAGERLDDLAVQIRAQCNLANVNTWLDRFDPASDHLRRALALCLRSGDRNGEAHVHYNLAHLGERQGRYAEALDHAERARDLYLAAGNRQSYAYAVNGVGWLHGLLGDHEQSLATCRQALAMLEELDDGTGQASTWDSIGHAHRHLGRHGEAVTCYQRALQMHRELGDRQSEASSSSNLGDAYHSAGDLDAARRCWQHALDLLDVVEHTDAEVAELRAKLAATTATPGGDHSRANR